MADVDCIKTCRKCRIEKPSSEFTKDARLKDGLQSYCKRCRSDMAIRRYAENPEAHRERRSRYYARNKDSCLASASKYKAQNKDRISAYSRNRRAKIRNADGSHTAYDVRALLEKQNNCCAICSCSIRNGHHVDHIKPLSAGGSNDKYNLQILCQKCNLSKNSRDPLDFMQSLGFLL